jgi:hypothetical protein
MGKKNLSVFKIPCLILFTIFILLPIYTANAETKTFIKEYTYHAGDEDRIIEVRATQLLPQLQL